MYEIKGNLFEVDTDIICITTNGFVKKNGKAVMGRGCAKEYLKYNRDGETDLGNAILEYGNIVNKLDYMTYSFPVKPIEDIFHGSNAVSHKQFELGEMIPGWACKADLNIIEDSCQKIVEIMNNDHPGKHIVLPRMGCGAGELDWETEVKPIAEKYFDDRFSIITWK